MIDSAATELKGGNHSEGFLIKAMGGGGGLWQAAKGRNLAPDSPEPDAKKPSTVLQEPERVLLFQPVLPARSDLDVPPCCVPRYIPHNTFFPSEGNK